MFESKQLRKEKKIFKKLMKKFNKAFLIEHEFNGTTDTDTFTIDNKFIIVCDSNGTLDVSRKDTTEKIISIKCAYDAEDPDAQAKSKLFKDFLRFAEISAQNFGLRQEYIKNKQKKEDATRQAQEQKRIYMAKLTKALSKLK